MTTQAQIASRSTTRILGSRALLLPGLLFGIVLLILCLLRSITLGAADITLSVVYESLFTFEATNFDHLIIQTVHELVAQGRYRHQGWLQQWSAEDERIAQEALALANLSAYAGRAVDTLSGGQRQRAWIAMTLAQDSAIILLDEPTTFLDLAYQIKVLDLLHDLNVERGKTIVMVLHDLNHACRYADTIVAVKDGGVAAHGAPDQIVTEAMVRDVFGIDCRIIPDPITGTPLIVRCGRGGKRILPVDAAAKNTNFSYSPALAFVEV